MLAKMPTFLPALTSDVNRISIRFRRVADFKRICVLSRSAHPIPSPQKTISEVDCKGKVTFLFMNDKEPGGFSEIRLLEGGRNFGKQHIIFVFLLQRPRCRVNTEAGIRSLVLVVFLLLVCAIL